MTFTDKPAPDRQRSAGDEASVDVELHPVTKEASSLARNATAAAISCGSPRRPIGVDAVIAFQISVPLA